MRRTFCARCHTVGLPRCDHRMRTSGAGGKHRARETYRVHPAKTFVDTPTSPFTFLQSLSTQSPTKSGSVAVDLAEPQAISHDQETFKTLMHQLWHSPHEPTGELPVKLVSPTTERRRFDRRQIFAVSLIVLAVLLGSWRVSVATSHDAGVLASAEKSLGGLRSQLEILPTTIGLVTSPDASGEDLSNAAASLGQWGTEASSLLNQGLAAPEDDPLFANRQSFADAGEKAREMQRLLADTLSTRLILGAISSPQNLPSELEAPEIADLSVDLALSIDEAESRLQLLPTSAQSVELAARRVLTGLATDQAIYLEALAARNQDMVDAAILSQRAREAELAQILANYLLGQQPAAEAIAAQLESLAEKLDR